MGVMGAQDRRAAIEASLEQVGGSWLPGSLSAGAWVDGPGPPAAFAYDDAAARSTGRAPLHGEQRGLVHPRPQPRAAVCGRCGRILDGARLGACAHRWVLGRARPQASVALALTQRCGPCSLQAPRTWTCFFTALRTVWSAGRSASTTLGSRARKGPLARRSISQVRSVVSDLVVLVSLPGHRVLSSVTPRTNAAYDR